MTWYSLLKSGSIAKIIAFLAILELFLPHLLPLWIDEEDSKFPTSLGKQGVDNQYFVCKGKACSPPSMEIEGILAKI